MIEYQKIYGPYKRYSDGPDKNKLIIGEWALPEFGNLASIVWQWTEKVDGTNIRVSWDGHRVTYGGRTENAQIPATLIRVLDELFPEELFEQKFGETSAILFGEGYGAKIQKGGGNYASEQKFVLFDVLIGEWWLLRADVEDVAKSLGVDVVPIILFGSVQSAINLITEGLQSSWGNFTAEGIVGVTPSGLRDRRGHRIMMKIKSKDFNES